MYRYYYQICLFFTLSLVFFPTLVHGEEYNGTPTGEYVLISNESVDGGQTEGTGETFNQLDKNNHDDTYKLDYHKPFNPLFSKTSLVKRNYLTTTTEYPLGSMKDFWVTNLDNDSKYQINAKLLYKGPKANVWVHNNQISSQDAEKLGLEFERNIHPTVTNLFGEESDIDHDGKVNILCFDIQDGFAGSGGYIGGYFYAGDLYNSSSSNQSEIFYIDTYPAMGTSTKDVTKSYETLAHEFQHMVNYNENVLLEGNSPMDVWLDEALAMAAEQAYTGKALKNRIEYYNDSTSIQSGHSLLYWDYNGDLLSNYSLSYLFGQYIKIQSNQGDHIFKEILADSNNDYKAVENVIKKYINPNMTFGQFMTAFRGALLVNAPSGLYGFKGETSFNELKPSLYDSNSSTNLRGGGAIVKKVSANMTIPSQKGSNITYTYFNQNGIADTLSPTKPIVNTVSDKDMTVSGTAEANARVYVKTADQLIGSGVANQDGSYTVTIPKQKAGVTLHVYVEDAALNKSEESAIVVVDKTAPDQPKIDILGDNQKVVTGKAEAGSTVHLKIGAHTRGEAIADNNGLYSFKLPDKQKAGSLVIVYAVDNAGNQSAVASTKVVDKTPPGTPTVSKVTSKSTSINGKAEKAATVYIYKGSTYLGKATVDKYGKYKVKMKAQKKNVTISVYVQDKTQNKSKKVYIKVK